MYDRGYFPKYSNDRKGHRKDPAGLLRDIYPHALDAWQHRLLVRATEKKKNACVTSLLEHDLTAVHVGLDHVAFVEFTFQHVEAERI